MLARKWNPMGGYKFLGIILEIYVYCFLILTVALKYTENYSWIESIWQVWQTYSTVGYGNSPAETVNGRSLIMAFSYIAIALYAGIGGGIIDIFINRREAKRKGLMNNPYTDQTVVLNMPEPHHMVRLIEETQHAFPEFCFCIVDNNIDELPTIVSEFKNIHFIRGSLTDKETYKRARIQEQKDVIIFPSRFDGSDVDAETRTVVELVCLLYTSPSPRDLSTSRMPSSA